VYGISDAGRSSDFRAGVALSGGAAYLSCLLGPPSAGQWFVTTFVPGHSGATVPELHRIPYSAAGPEPTATSPN